MTPLYFAAQPAIVSRLQATLPAGVPVRTAADFEQAKDQAIGQPEVWVVFHSDQLADKAGRQTLLTQRWAVLYFAPGVMPDLQRDGAVLSAITKALAGYDPNLPGLGEFERTGSLVPMTFGGDSLVGYGQLFSISLDL